VYLFIFDDIQTYITTFISKLKCTTFINIAYAQIYLDNEKEKECDVLKGLKNKSVPFTAVH